MIERPFWVEKILKCWMTRPIVWLSGVRRAGKTTISKMLENAVYNNCDLPSVVRKLEDPEAYLKSIREGSIVIFDEIHRLEDPSRLLKIAADEFSHLKVLATGSSTLEATSKFKDTLTGRKHTVNLTPILWDECLDIFNINNLDHRLLFGGLPEAFLGSEREEQFYAEWIDSFYARDIQELFNVRNRSGFLKLMQLVFRSSGSLLEVTTLSKLSGITRPTVMSYLEAMRISNMLFVLPPYHGRGKREITQRPKYYAFDTGMVCFINGWNSIRESDRGLLWEHLVLDTLRSQIHDRNLYYWRDKSGREVDFVLTGQGKGVDVIECKINPDHLNPGNIKVFRDLYPEGKNYCLSPYTGEPYSVEKSGMLIHFIGSAKRLMGF